jgi:2',3'-cyclic-nucleotide 2'-phosphodiesterase (5'-nucleotidase family)
MKKITMGFVLFIVILSFCFVVSAIEDQKVGSTDEVNIFILNTGDIHEASGKLEKISQYIDQKRSEHGKDHVLLLDAGDMLSHWTPKSRTPFAAPKRNWALERKEERGSKVNQMYNWAVGMNYDAMIFGNHDFDEGILVEILYR